MLLQVALPVSAAVDMFFPMTVLERLNVHQKYRFCVNDFLLLAPSGAFRDYARTELIEGEILAANAIHSRHAKMQAKLHILIAAALAKAGSALETYLTPSIPMGDKSVPEPDIVIAEDGSEDFLPLEKVRIAIEVSDSTLDYDLGRKAALYALHGVPEYWVVDIERRVMHQMWTPGDGSYAERVVVAFGEIVKAVSIDGLSIETLGL